MEAGNDIALDAARDVNILPGAESYASEEKEKRSGIGIQVSSGNGSASIGIGYGSSKTETRQGAETNATSSLSAGRDVIITAGRDANLQAAQVEAGSTVDILAERDVNLLSAQDKTNYETMHEELFAGIKPVPNAIPTSISSFVPTKKKTSIYLDSLLAWHLVLNKPLPQVTTSKNLQSLFRSAIREMPTVAIPGHAAGKYGIQVRLTLMEILFCVENRVGIS